MTILLPPEPAIGATSALTMFGTDKFNEELNRRHDLHNHLDAAYLGVLAPGDTKPVPASSRLYAGRWADEVATWRWRYATAVLLALGFFPLRTVVSTAAPTLFSDRAKVPRDPVGLTCYLIGRYVHRVIGLRYIKEFPGDEVVVDGVVHAPNKPTERLSRRARDDDRRGMYGALNYGLARGRCDLVNFSKAHLWEIKPAGLAPEAVLQEWGYLDGYEVARMMAFYEGEGILGPLRPGPAIRGPKTMPPSVLEPVEFSFGLGPSAIVIPILPFIVSGLDGLILYSIGNPRSRQTSRAQADAKMQASIAQVKLGQLFDVAGVVLEQRRADAEQEFRDAMVVVGFYVLIGLLAGFGIGGAVAGGAEATAGVGGTAQLLAGTGAAAVGAEAVLGDLLIARLNAVVADAVAREAAKALVGMAAESVVIGLADRDISGISPLTGGLAVDVGLGIGSTLAPSSPPSPARAL